MRGRHNPAVIPERCGADLLPWYEAIVPTSSGFAREETSL
jgi:hypothetical protein